MQRQEVTSSNVESIGYDQSTGTMEVAFKNGSIYEYYAIPPNLHEELMSSPSIGTFLSTHVKKAGFEYKQLA